MLEFGGIQTQSFRVIIQPGFGYYQGEIAFTMESGIPGERLVYLVGQKSQMGYGFDGVWRPLGSNSTSLSDLRNKNSVSIRVGLLILIVRCVFLH